MDEQMLARAAQAFLGGEAEGVDGTAVAESANQNRDFLGTLLGHLGNQGVDVNDAVAQTGVSTTDPNAMNHADILQTILGLAQQHPEIVALVAQQFPQAQNLLQMVGMGNIAQGNANAGGNDGGFLGGLLGRVLGG